jgi:hypothetical protein
MQEARWGKRRIPGRARSGPAAGAPLGLDPEVSGAGRPGHRRDPPAVGGVAAPDAAGVCGPPAGGRGPDGVGGAVCRDPTGATARPTPERGLERVEGLPLTSIRAGRRRRSHLTPLAQGQRRMLALRNCPVDIDTRRL